MPNGLTDELRHIIAAWEAAWSEPDDSARRRLLEHALVDDAMLVGSAPIGKRDGVDEINAFLGSFLPERCPHGRIVNTSAIEELHGFLRYTWTIYSGDDIELEGMDVAEIAPDGRLCRIITFFGLTPGPKAGMAGTATL